MAKKQSKVKPLFPKLNPAEMTRQDLSLLSRDDKIIKYNHTDSDVATPFGTIRMRECNISDLEYGDCTPLLYDFDSINEAIKAKDWIESVVLLEKAIEKYPKAVVFHFQLAESYLMLKQDDKARFVKEENYAINKGLPLVDMYYVNSGSDEDVEEYPSFYNDKKFNIHEAYPKRKYFHSTEILEYYCYIGESALNDKDIDIPLAKQSAKMVLQIDPKSNKGYILKAMIARKKDPIKTRIKVLGSIAIVLSIVGLIIWGIYRLFAWIFWDAS